MEISTSHITNASVQGLGGSVTSFEQESRLRGEFYDAISFIDKKRFELGLILGPFTKLRHGMSLTGLAMSAAGVAVSPASAVTVVASNAFVGLMQTSANAVNLMEVIKGTPYDKSIFAPTKAFNNTADTIKKDAQSLFANDDNVRMVEKTADEIKSAVHNIVHGTRIQGFLQPALAIGATVTGAMLGGAIGASAGLAAAHGEQIIYDTWKKHEWTKIESGFELLGEVFEQEKQALEKKSAEPALSLN